VTAVTNLSCVCC